ncbi:MAG: hypothetical protein ACLFN8_00415 [Candidatus Woesearchaeota archaeon]
MGDEVIQTEVDRLIDILKTKKKIDIKSAAKELNVDEEIVQQWVDFLVEEKIISMEYDFTKPIISLVNNTKLKEENPEDNIKKYKKKFQGEKQTKGNSEVIWKNHVLDNLEFMKPFFYTEADKRNLENKDELWEQYKQKVSGI